MFVYFIVYLITIVLCNTNYQESKSGYLKHLIIAFIPLFLFSSLMVGYRDEESYIPIYNAIHAMPTFIPDMEAHSEVGFQFLCYIMPSLRLLQIFDALLMCSAFVVFFYNNVPSNRLKLAFTLLFLSGNYSIYFIICSMRNGIAISLLLLGFSLLQNRKIIFFILLTLLASLFHTTALFAFPLAFIVGRSSEFTLKELFVWLGCWLFFIVTSTTGIMSRLTPFINEYFDRYNSVVEEMMNTGDTFHPLAYLGSLISLLFLGYCINANKSLSEKQLSLLRAAMLFPMASVMAGLNMRMNQYYVLIFIAAVTQIAGMTQNLKWKKEFSFYAIAYIGYSFYLWTQGTWFCYWQYHSVLEKML